jgi:hypothetical protein
MRAEVVALAPEAFQVIASSPGECAEAVCAISHDQSGAPWRYGEMDWDAVAERLGTAIRVVPVAAGVEGSRG